MHECRVGVVIPARTCPCRQALKVLDQCAQEDQVVIVANGLKRSEDCRQRVGHHPRVTWIEAGEALGASRARNVGVNFLSGASTFLFCDADDLVGDCWLGALVRPLVNGLADLVGGTLSIGRGAQKRITLTPDVDFGYQQALFGGNLGITCRAWHLLNGFDESFDYCEDTDLAWRAASSGLTIKVVRDAVVHVELNAPIKELRQRFRWGKSTVKLLDSHNVTLDYLPSFRDLYRDKKASGFATNPSLASFGQWVGQRHAMFCLRKIRGRADTPN